jgi:hypothetical protein
MLTEKVSAAFSFLMISFIPGMWRIHGDQLDLDFWLSTNERYPDFKHKNTWEALWAED